MATVISTLLSHWPRALESVWFFCALQGEEMGDCWRHVPSHLQVGASYRAQIRWCEFIIITTTTIIKIIKSCILIYPSSGLCLFIFLSLYCMLEPVLLTNIARILLLQKNKNKKKGKDEKYGSEVTTPENSSSPGMMDMHGGCLCHAPKAYHLIFCHKLWSLPTATTIQNIKCIYSCMIQLHFTENGKKRRKVSEAVGLPGKLGKVR